MGYVGFAVTALSVTAGRCFVFHGRLGVDDIFVVLDLGGRGFATYEDLIGRSSLIIAKEIRAVVDETCCRARAVRMNRLGGRWHIRLVLRYNRHID
jgi:hypothetical protein